MNISQSLRKRTAQHKPKNDKSKDDDKRIYAAMEQVTGYLNTRFNIAATFPDLRIDFDHKIAVSEMIAQIKKKNLRNEFDLRFAERSIIPDGGALFLTDTKTGLRRPLLIAEVKRQGTNDARVREGEKRQSTGNAIERLGKNLTGIRAMMCHEKITPFICFGWGCDFAEDELTVLSKVSMLNEFYPLNKTYIFKRDGSADSNFFSPVSLYFREKRWSIEEMFDIMKEIAETAFRYYVY